MSYYEMRAAGSGEGHGRIVTGYATTFDQYYTLLDAPDMLYKERIDRHAFDKTNMRDVVMLYNHDGRIAARTTNGTLELSTDDTGLMVRARLDSTDISRLTYDEIKTGLTPQMSMGFKVAKDRKVTEEDKKTGRITLYRTILEISRLYDVSSVSFPANPYTAIVADEKRGLQLLMLKRDLDREHRILELRKMLNKILNK